jgi:hypothetical protein
VFRPGSRGLDGAIALRLWDRILTRFFVWASIGMAGILVSGIAMVFLKFGGFSSVPILHPANTALGIPAIVLYGYLCFGPWPRFRSAMSAADSIAAEKSLGQFRILAAIILSLDSSPRLFRLRVVISENARREPSVGRNDRPNRKAARSSRLWPITPG